MKNKGISLQNYEEFIIDYLDGKLDTVEVAELLLFFEQNPDLKEEAAEIGLFTLEPEARLTFEFAEALKQPADNDAIHLNTGNYEHYFIAAHEGDLSEKGTVAVEQFLNQHAELRHEFNLYKAARLRPNKEIYYPAKAELKRKVIAAWRNIFYYGAAAASILILISIYLRISPESDKSLQDTIGGIEQPTIKATARIENSEKENEILPSAKQADILENAPKPHGVVRQKTIIKETVKANAGNKPIEENLSPLPQKHFINVSSPTPESQQRNFYSDLYEDIRLSQEIMLAGLETRESDDVNDNQPEILTRFKAGRRANSLLSSGAQIASQIPENLNGWLLADIGISGINMLTDNDLKLQRDVNTNGEVSNIRLSEGGKNYSLRRRNN
ncbi:MAG: hypothetical protein H6541_01795 [Lentimicrobiaceae bacterium]|nr:hypothetical protein [Lentimicrobiaceae bacterium]MCB9023143.1 hypothetical protein [Lentimicrobiaceae bacterium]